MKTNVSSIVKKTKPLSCYIRRIANGNYQLFLATGLALPDHHSDHYSRLEAQQTARTLNASVVMEVLACEKRYSQRLSPHVGIMGAQQPHIHKRRACVCASASYRLCNPDQFQKSVKTAAQQLPKKQNSA